MSVQWQNIPIHFGKGIDTKTDPKLVVPGKILRLQDAVFTQVDQYNKRNGYRVISSSILGGGNLVAPKMAKAYQNELVCADQGTLYSYSSTQACWVPKGAYLPVAVSKSVISRSTPFSHVGTSGAALGNIAVFASSVNRVPTASIVDLSTGVSLVSDFQLCSAGATVTAIPIVQCIVAGGSVLGVFYLNTLYKIAYRPITVTGTTASFGAEVVLTAAAPGGAPNYFFTACATSAGAAISYYLAAGNISVFTINSAGSIQNTAAITTTATNGTVSLNQESGTSRIWVYFLDASGGNWLVRYAVFDSSLSSVLSSTTIISLATASFSVVFSITAYPVSSGNQKVIYGYYNKSASTSGYETIYSAAANSSGTVGTPALLINGLLIYSDPIAYNGSYYFAANNISATQATLFIINASTGVVVAKGISGTANDYRGYLISDGSHAISRPFLNGSSQPVFPTGETYVVTTVNGAKDTLGISALGLDFSSTELYQTLEANENLVLNGGQVYSYDGQGNTELGFSLAPVIVSTSVSGGGTMADGVYDYFATYRWTDAKGNIYESAPSVGASVTVSGHSGSGSVTLTISTLTTTRKQAPLGNAQIVVYRTAANGASNTATETQDQSSTPALPTQNDPTANVVTFVDTVPDSYIASSTPLYTNGGSLSNIAPPPALAMSLHNNRLWVIDSENRNSIWYTKTFLNGAGVNFSDELTVQVDSVGGDCVALAGMDDKLVIFEQNLPIVVAGDGANDTGTGSTLTNPQPIPADTGASQSKGVIVSPMGVFVKTPKGIYLLDRSLSFKYLGMDVEAYNSQTITAATMMPSTSQIRFLCSSGLTLVYDYIFNQWSTFTNHTGYSADIWNSTYVYARTDGAIYQESSGYYLDNNTAFAPLIQTAWLSLASIQGFQRLRRFESLGTFANGASASHGVQVSAAYDFGTNFSTPVQYLFGAALASGVFQYRERLLRQKCDSISLLIQEVTTGDSAETVSFTDMSFEAGIKRGLNKLAQTNTVG